MKNLKLQQKITKITESTNQQTDDNNMDLETHIWHNSFYNCDKCEYKSKSRKGIKIHMGTIHNNNIEKQEIPDKMGEEDDLVNCETLKCNLCEMDDFSEKKIINPQGKMAHKSGTMVQRHY